MTIEIGHDEKADSKFLETLGRCIVAWSNIEMQMCNVFIRLLRTSERQPAAAAFYAALAFETKLSMVNEAAKHSLAAEQKSEWDALSDRISKKQRTRNRLAHFQLQHVPSPSITHQDGTVRTDIDKSTFQPTLAACFVNPQGDPNSRYRQHDLDTFLTDLGNLHFSLFQFERKLSEVLASKHPPAGDAK